MKKLLILNIVILSCTAVLGQSIKSYTIKKVEPIFFSTPPQYLKLVDTLDPDIRFVAAPLDFGGLKPAYPIAMSVETIRCNFTRDIKCLYGFSGFSRQISNLYILKNKEVIEINTFEKFKEIYAPVDDKEEALSFVAAKIYCQFCSGIIYNFKFLKNNTELKVLKKELTPSSVTEVENGYKVIIITEYYDYYEQEYFVNKTGDIEKIGKEMIIEFLGTRMIFD